MRDILHADVLLGPIVPCVTAFLCCAAGGRTAGSAGRAGAMSAAPHLPPGMSGLAMARHIVHAEGVLGLYRGFGASIVTFVPSSALWWGSYGFYQRLIWQQVGFAHKGGVGRVRVW